MEKIVWHFRTTQIEQVERSFLSLYKGDGLNNEDWFGWEAPLLAPCDGVVNEVTTNPVTNEPGQQLIRGEIQPAAHITFTCEDNVNVIYAHIRNPYVEEGDEVKAGALVAEVGNNGMSRSPHVHIGAWKDEAPLQIRFDLRLLHN